MKKKFTFTIELKHLKHTIKALKPFFLLLLCFIILLIVEVIPKDFFIGSLKLKKPKLYSDLVKKQLFIKKIETVNVKFTPLKLDIKTSLVGDYDSLDIIDFITDSIQNMTKFYESLFQIKKQKKKVRIAYFGDSMIEGDLITQDLRAYFQNKYGGNGVGMMPITSITAGFRQTIIHKFSDNWNAYSFADFTRKNENLGLLGFSFTHKIDDTVTKNVSTYVEFKAVNKFHLNNFENVILFSGKGENKNSIEVNGIKHELAFENDLNVDTLCFSKKIKKLNLKFDNKYKQSYYGLSFESDSGVIVDNFAFRGNSGIPLTKIKSETYKDFNKFLNYDLIILHYGLNVVSEKSEDYNWYKRNMSKTIKYLKSCFPNTAFLLVSVNDKSYKVEDKFETIPGVPLLVEIQKNIAKENNIAFWNLYENMGGYNSMIKWVEADTALANKDYTHLNFRGASLVSKMMLKSLMKGYENWQNEIMMLNSKISKSKIKS